jgi:hypothetical protein
VSIGGNQTKALTCCLPAFAGDQALRSKSLADVSMIALAVVTPD